MTCIRISDDGGSGGAIECGHGPVDFGCNDAPGRGALPPRAATRAHHGAKADRRPALEVLERNNTDSFVVPSSRQYPHLWLWDACFHAIILAELRPELAGRELEALVEGQEPDGMIPHVRFNPFAHPSQYRPNETDWATGGPVSGVTQPPLVAPALKIVFQRTCDTGLLRRIYPRVVRFHEWLKSVRDPDDTGLAAIIHPWESGMDNNPSFDGLMEAFNRRHLPRGLEPPPRADTRCVPPDQRPTDDYYLFYWGLIRRFQSLHWDQRAMVRHSPVLVADVLFNSVWAKANEDLADLAWALGRTRDRARFLAWADQTRRALRRHCWHPRDRFFYSVDLRTRRRIPVKTIAGFMPMYAQAPTGAMADALVDHLMNRREFYFHVGVPSVSFDSPWFDSRRYWRGSVWLNMHWLLTDGLWNYGYSDIAAQIQARSHRLVSTQGYWEYYDPLTGQGLGAPDFSWSVITAIMRPLPPPEDLRKDVLVLAPDEADRHPELRTLYRHPGNRRRRLTERDITSVPPTFAVELLEAVKRHPVAVPAPVAGARIPDQLRLVAAIVQRLIQDRRPAWAEYPRLCDLACLAGREVFAGLGYHCEIRWSPDLHFFLLVRSPGGAPWIVDLSPTQFSWHPMSRIPLLLERASLAVEAALQKGGRPPLALERLLRDTQVAVQALWVQLERTRMDRHQQKAFLYGCRRHRELVDRLTERMPLAGPFLKEYLRWLAGIAGSAGCRPAGRRVAREVRWPRASAKRAPARRANTVGPVIFQGADEMKVLSA